MKVEEITPASRGIEIAVTVVEKLEQREVTTRDGQPHKVAEFLVGDPSGCIIMSLWDASIESVEVGKSYNIKNAYVNVFRNSMRISLSKQGGAMTESTDTIEANTKNNISDKHVESPQRFGSGGFGVGDSSHQPSSLKKTVLCKLWMAVFTYGRMFVGSLSIWNQRRSSHLLGSMILIFPFHLSVVRKKQTLSSILPVHLRCIT